MEHSTILSTFVKLQFVIQVFVLSICEWPFYTGFTVHHYGQMVYMCQYRLRTIVALFVVAKFCVCVWGWVGGQGDRGVVMFSPGFGSSYLLGSESWLLVHCTHLCRNILVHVIYQVDSGQI